MKNILFPYNCRYHINSFDMSRIQIGPAVENMD